MLFVLTESSFFELVDMLHDGGVSIGINGITGTYRHKNALDLARAHPETNERIWESLFMLSTLSGPDVGVEMWMGNTWNYVVITELPAPMMGQIKSWRVKPV